MKPVTRQEIFENAVAEGKAPNIKPLTREEIVLAKHARREASGGGGGGESTAPYIVVFRVDEEANEDVLDKNESTVPTFATMMEHFNKGQMPRINMVYHNIDVVRVEELNIYNHATSWNGHDVNAFHVGNWPSFWVTDENEVLTDSEFSEKYPDHRE